MVAPYGNVVVVKYLGPTNHRPSRWSAQVKDGGMNSTPRKRWTSSRDQTLSPAADALRVALIAMDKEFDYGVDAAIAYGDLSSSEYVFIF